MENSQSKPEEVKVHHKCHRSFLPATFCHPYTEVSHEAHARLGIAFKCLENFSQSLKHLLIALDDSKESPLLPKYQIRFHIAHCYDGSGDFRRAIEEYRRLVADHEKGLFRLPTHLLAAVFRQQGWIYLRAREKELKEEVRQQKLKEAELHLLKAKDISPLDSKTNCYLGLCHSEQTTLPVTLATSNSTSGGGPQHFTPPPPPNQHLQQQQTAFAAEKAQEAFVCYRSAIDSDESDANTWTSIGVLYQQQNQPIDALQAFACAVQLDEKHSAAWTELGRLYEAHRQYQEALHCYKKALQNSPASPALLKFRIGVLEKEFSGSNPAALAHILHGRAAVTSSTNTTPGAPTSTTARPGAQPIQPLPSLENAWQLGIPAQVRQRLLDLYKQQQNRYREGSSLWTMSELAAHSLRQPFYELDPTQRQIMQVLKLNKEQLEHNELSLLRQLEERYTAIMGAASNSNSSNPNANLSHTSDKTSPSKSHSDQNTQDPNHSSLKLKISKGEIAQTSGLPCLSQDDLEDLLGDTSNLIKSSEDIVSSDVLLTSVADATKANQASTSQVQEESDHHQKSSQNQPKNPIPNNCKKNGYPQPLMETILLLFPF
uniref:Uncharacterized protein n=1 Tax=Ditylenchus dipsaci TaxID=166011 RepID=A0A915CZR9_9BILA